MPVPIGYDEYLKMAFGDYMKLPPQEQRVLDMIPCILMLRKVIKSLKVYTMESKKNR